MTDGTVFIVVLFALIAAMNVLTFSMFGLDKYRAHRGHWRIPEHRLLSFALFGGAVGAKMEQKYFSHKTTKQPFACQLNAICLLQVLAVMLLVFPPSRQRVFSGISAFWG